MTIENHINKSVISTEAQRNGEIFEQWLSNIKDFSSEGVSPEYYATDEKPVSFSRNDD